MAFEVVTGATTEKPGYPSRVEGACRCWHYSIKPYSQDHSAVLVTSCRFMPFSKERGMRALLWLLRREDYLGRVRYARIVWPEETTFWFHFLNRIVYQFGIHHFFGRS